MIVAITLRKLIIVKVGTAVVIAIIASVVIRAFAIITTIIGIAKAIVCRKILNGSEEKLEITKIGRDLIVSLKAMLKRFAAIHLELLLTCTDH